MAGIEFDMNNTNVAQIKVVGVGGAETMLLTG